MAEGRQRLDELVLARGLAPDLKTARAQVLAGNVLVDERCVDKCGARCAPAAAVRLKRATEPYVSRGGVKLAGALAAARLTVTGWRALDAGAATGGFTDCLLQHGASAVTALDVGRGLLAHKLRIDPRVTVVENRNIRTVRAGELGEPFDLVVADLSFISLRTALPALTGQVRLGGQMLLLVKPQFEVEKGRVGTGGIVRDDAARQAAIAAVADAVRAAGLAVKAIIPSSLTGAKGNQEYFIHIGCLVLNS